MNKTLIFRTALVWTLIAFAIITAAAAPVAAQQASKTDMAVQTVIENRLAQNKLLENNQIQVAVANGDINLQGQVQTLWDKMRAEKYSAEKGYKTTDNLTIMPRSLTNQQLADSIMRRLDGYTFYSIFDWVSVSAQNGVVTLGGWAHERWLKKQFENQVARVKGVMQIINQIEALPISSFDDEIRHRAAELIYDDPMFESYAYVADRPVHIIVNEGNVILEGEVAAPDEKSWASQLIRINTNAMNVDNQLKVQ